MLYDMTQCSAHPDQANSAPSRLLDCIIFRAHSKIYVSMTADVCTCKWKLCALKEPSSQRKGSAAGFGKAGESINRKPWQLLLG